eukprot:gene2750-551_t
MAPSNPPKGILPGPPPSGHDQGGHWSFGRGPFSGQSFNWTALDAAMDIVLGSGLLPGFEAFLSWPWQSITPTVDLPHAKAIWLTFHLYPLSDTISPGDGTSHYLETFPVQIHSWMAIVQQLADHMIASLNCHSSHACSSMPQCLNASIPLLLLNASRTPALFSALCIADMDLQVGIQCDLPSFLAYFDATNYGLRAAHPNIIFGGPASDGSFEFLTALVEHCVNGSHFITQKPGCGRVDFFNLHAKGHASTYDITSKELPLAKWVHSYSQGTPYAAVAWGNDEADPLGGWDKNLTWRADAHYAAMVPKVINQHQHFFVDSGAVTYDVLSNDNGFLPYPDNQASLFTQRTLVARWAMNKTHTVESMRKPVLNVMALLAMLGNELHTLEGAEDPSTAAVGQATEISLHVSNLLGNDTRVAMYYLDNQRGNPYRIWQEVGHPVYPSYAMFAEMRAEAEVAIEVQPAPSGNFTISLNLPSPGVQLVHFCTRNSQGPPPAASKLRVMLTWSSPHDACVQPYDVFYHPPEGAAPIQLSPSTLFGAFVHQVNSSSVPYGRYAVQTMDYWGEA